jgi:hypothetical protein
MRVCAGNAGPTTDPQSASANVRQLQMYSPYIIQSWPEMLVVFAISISLGGGKK